MTIPQFIRYQLSDIVDSYDNFYKKTFGTTVFLTFLCFLSAAVLFKFSLFDKESTAKQSSLISYFFSTYSKMDTYSIVDLVKPLFVFFVSIFSLGLSTWISKGDPESKFSILLFFRNINLRPILVLLFTLFVSCTMDFVLFNCDRWSLYKISDKAIDNYIHLTIFHLRIYVPLLLFSISKYFLTDSKKYKLTIRRLTYLYVALWLFNEFAYDIFLWTRNHLFDLVIIPIYHTDYVFIIESILGLPLVACYFLGYHSAMSNSLKLTEPVN